MAIENAIRRLNQIKRRRIIKDYAIIGGVATAAYMEPMFTEDVDIVVLVDSDDEFYEVFCAVSEISDKLEGLRHIIDGTLVQLLPTTIKPLYRDVLEKAVPVRVGNLHTKVATAEHLIVMSLEPFRDKDRVRIMALLGVADQAILHDILERFDDENGTLTQRLNTLR